MVEIAKRNNVSEKTIYRYKTIFSWQEQRPTGVKKPRRKACSTGRKNGQSGAWGGPNERIGKSQRDIPIHCSPTVSQIWDTPHPPGKVHPSGLAYVI